MSLEDLRREVKEKRKLKKDQEEERKLREELEENTIKGKLKKWARKILKQIF